MTEAAPIGASQYHSTLLREFTMFSRFTRRLRQSVLVLFACLGLIAAPQANADTYDSCILLLRNQDYVGAESEARNLIKRQRLDQEGQMSTWACLGHALREQGRAQEALPAYQQALALSQTNKEQAVAYRLLGRIYADLNNLERAESYHQLAIKAEREVGSKYGEALSLHDLAKVVERRGAIERALSLYQQALAISPYEDEKSDILSDISGIYENRGEYDKAVSLLHQALDIDRRQDKKRGTAIHELNLGRVLYRQGKLDEADAELNAGLRDIHRLVDRGLGDKKLEASASVYSAWVSKAKNDNHSAKVMYVRAEEIYREIGDVSSADKMAADAAALGKGK